MSTLWKVLLIILVVLIIALIVLYFVGRRLERRQAEQQVQIEAAKQNVTLLIIDKKRVPLKDAGLPDAVIESTPKLLRRSKMPIVKVKYGPKVMNMVADEKIFDMIPLKKEVRATVSGIYITDVRGLHGSVEVPQTTKKKGIFFSDAAPGLFSEDNTLSVLLGLLNTKFAAEMIRLINPTLNFVPGAVANVPIHDNTLKNEKITDIVNECVGMSQNDWDSYETSWDFKRNPLV